MVHYCRYNLVTLQFRAGAGAGAGRPDTRDGTRGGAWDDNVGTFVAFAFLSIMCMKAKSFFNVTYVMIQLAVGGQHATN